jgi:osmotically-inducible protein OsmY
MKALAIVLTFTVLVLAACTPQQERQSQATVQRDTSRTGVAIANGSLEVKVSAAIAAEAGVNAVHVTPKARNGVVTLTGSVPTGRIRATVLETVRRVPGVTKVINRLVVRGSM